MPRKEFTIDDLLRNPDCMASDILLSNTDNPTEDDLIKIALDEITLARTAISRKRTTINKYIDSLDKTKENLGGKAKTNRIVKEKCTASVGYIEEINVKRK